MSFGSQYLLKVNTILESPVMVGTKVIIPSIHEITTLAESNQYRTISYKETYLNIDKPVGSNSQLQSDGSFVFDQTGTYKITYSGIIQNEYSQSHGSGTIEENFSFSYYIQVLENQYPMKKQTVKDVINRILLTCEPLVVERQPDNTAKFVKEPRFLFGYKYPEDTADGKAERALFAQTSPEFTFTRCTLREALQQVGQFIHAEPRIIFRTVNGERRMVVIFDRYGEQDHAVYTPNYVGEVKRLLLSANTVETQEKLFKYLDELITEGGHAKEFAEKVQKDLSELLREKVTEEEQALAQDNPDFAEALESIDNIKLGFNSSTVAEEPVEPIFNEETNNGEDK